MSHLMCKILIFILLSTTVYATPTGDNIIISEVEYDPAAPDTASEWFELYNPTGSSIDISGWMFTDGEGTVTIPATTPPLAPGAYFIATHTATAGELTHYAGVTVDLAYGSIDVGSLALANSGDELTLLNAVGTVIDFVSWEGHTAGWNIEADDSESIVRSGSIDTDVEVDWLSHQVPTPGTGTLIVNIPTVLDDNSTVNEDASVNILVTNNDSFGANGPGTTAISIITMPINGTATVNDAGTPFDPSDDSIEYVPIPNFNGNDTLIYEIEDASGDTASASVNITVTSIPDFPTANDDFQAGISGLPVSISVLDNDTGLNPLDPTSVVIIDTNGNEVTQFVIPDEGVWEVDTSTGDITFTPELGFRGDPTAIRYTVADDEGDVSNQATVNIDYPQGSPQATDNLDIDITYYGVTIIDVLANGDSFGILGAGSEPITFTQPQYGTVSLDDGGTPNDPVDDKLLYTPDPDLNYLVVDFTYTITDAIGNTATARVVLNIVCVSTQRSDSGNTLGYTSFLMMIFMTLLIGIYSIRKETEA